MKKYIPSAIESKWQKKWDEDGLYKVDLTDSRKRQYILVEFSYPSGDLHMGHWFAFAVPDIFARFKRMQGYSVFFPNGFDAFGLPAENAAIKKGIHPKDWTLTNIEKMKQQFSTMGASFNWEQEVITCLPEYYKWNQWIFLKMLERGIAYKGKALANWCPNCQTVLANENVEAGKCWRCGTEVIQKEVEQWFLKLTAYADRLLWKDDTEVDWPVSVKVGQNNWIGRSEGVLIEFKIQNSRPKADQPLAEKFKIDVFTTRPETTDGATFVVISPEHPIVASLLSSKFKVQSSKLEEIRKYIEKTKKKSELERTSLEKEKTGVFTGSFCINPVNGKKIPIWIADYVLMGYGTGAIMAVPFADQRDKEFAQKFKLPVIETNFTAKPEGQKQINYHIHDWSVSRQRYWGTPIPIIYCRKCWEVQSAKCKVQSAEKRKDYTIIDGLEYAIISVPEEDLPVELPYEVDYAPSGKPPLATAEDWVNVKCPKCGSDAKREVETMDTFFDSSWYFFRYLDPKNSQKIFNRKVVEDWLPLDIYFGGAEHTLGHTLYSRFFTKFFQDLGLINIDEYAKKRMNRGLILGTDGQKMSKSRGNVVNPDEQVKQYGADAVRLYLAFIGPYASTVAPWDNAGLNGVYHFLQRVWGLYEKVGSNESKEPEESKVKETSGSSDPAAKGGSAPLSPQDLRMMHKTIKRVTEDLEEYKFNTAVAALMEWLNYLSAKEKVEIAEYQTLLLLLAPFAPHIAEELWQNIRFFEMGGEKWDLEVRSLEFKESRNQDQKYLTSNVKNSRLVSIHSLSWPKFDDKCLQEEEIKVVVQINGKVRDVLLIQKDIVSSRESVEKMALGSSKAQKFLKGKIVKKTVYIEGKIISFVVSS